MSAVGGRPVRMRGTATNSGAGDGGIQVHADAAAVNVNIWLNDPDDNAVDSAAGVAGAEPGIAAGSSGAGAAGLLVYKREPPSDWGPDKWNQGAHAGRWLEETNAPRVRCRPPIIILSAVVASTVMPPPKWARSRVDEMVATVCRRSAFRGGRTGR